MQWIDGTDTANSVEAGTTRDGPKLTAPAGGDNWLVYLTAR